MKLSPITLVQRIQCSAHYQVPKSTFFIFLVSNISIKWIQIVQRIVIILSRTRLRYMTSLMWVVASKTLPSRRHRQILFFLEYAIVEDSANSEPSGEFADLRLRFWWRLLIVIKQSVKKTPIRLCLCDRVCPPCFSPSIFCFQLECEIVRVYVCLREREREKERERDIYWESQFLARVDFRQTDSRWARQHVSCRKNCGGTCLVYFSLLLA